MRARIFSDRRPLGGVGRLLGCAGVLTGGLALLLGSLAGPALAQGPGLPRGYQIQRVDSPSPILAGGFGLQTLSIGDVNGDGESDFATNQTEGSPNNEGQVWVFSGETGAVLGTFPAPDAGGTGLRALVDRWMDRLGDIGSCPGGTAGQTCSGSTIGAPDGANEFLLGAEGVDVGGQPDIGRVYVIDGRTLAVLKRIDMPPADRATIAARRAQFPASNARGQFGRTASTPRGLPPCEGNSGVGACPDTTAIPTAVRIGDMDGGGQPDIVIGANRFTEIGSTANPASHCAKQADPNGICQEAGRAYIYRGEEIAGSNPAVNLDGSGPGQTPPRVIRNLAAQSDVNDTTFSRTEILGHAQMPIGDVGQCRSGGAFPVVSPGDVCSIAARTNVPDGRPDVIIASHRADTPIFNPDPGMFEAGITFLVDGATGAYMFTYTSPEPQPNALFGYTTRQSFPLGDLAGGTSVLPDIVLASFHDAQNRAQAGRAFLFNGDVTAAFQTFGQMNDPTPHTFARFGIPTEGVGNLDPTKAGNEVLVGNFASTGGRPDGFTDMHFFNPVDGLLQTIKDPDNELSGNFGYQAAPLGDLNEDGFLDFATSAPNWDSPGVGGAQGIRDQGRIYIVRSDNSPAPAGPAATPPAAAAPVAPGASTPAVTRAARSITLTPSKSRVARRGAVTLAGKITAATNAAGCAAGQSVVIERRQAGNSRFTRVTTVRSAASGTFSRRIKPTRTYTYRARVAQTATCLAAASRARKVTTV